MLLGEIPLHTSIPILVIERMPPWNISPSKTLHAGGGGGGGRTGLVVRASDSGSGNPGSILGRSVCCFLEQETFTPQKYW